MHYKNITLRKLNQCLFFLFCILFSKILFAVSHDPDSLKFDDSRLENELVYPDWFKLSLGDLRDDLKQARKAGKRSIIAYFGQKDCAYCEQFLRTDLSNPDIQNYLRQHYNVIAIDIWGTDDIIDTDDKKYSEHGLALHYKTNFTPSLVFYDPDGKPVFRLRGFYPAYKFRAALKYVTEGFYKDQTFRDYLARAEQGDFFLLGGLNERNFFSPPPYNLPSLLKNGKPLSVFFDQGNCHACDLLHSGPLNTDATINEMQKMNAIQLNMWKNTALITPDGKKTTARDWAKQLNIFYAPTLVFFSPAGKEVMRIDSVVQFYRLLGVLKYVNQAGYKQEPNYQIWRLKQRKLIQ